MTSITVCILCDDWRMHVSTTQNHRIFNTRSGVKLQTTWYKMLSFLSWCTCKVTLLFLRMKRFIDRPLEAYFFGQPCIHRSVVGWIVSILRRVGRLVVLCDWELMDFMHGIVDKICDNVHPAVPKSVWLLRSSSNLDLLNLRRQLFQTAAVRRVQRHTGLTRHF